MDTAAGETHPHATARVNGSKQREWIPLRPMGITAAHAPKYSVREHALKAITLLR